MYFTIGIINLPSLVTVHTLTGLKKTDGVDYKQFKPSVFFIQISWTLCQIYFLVQGIPDDPFHNYKRSGHDRVQGSPGHDYPQYKKIKIRHFLQ